MAATSILDIPFSSSDALARLEIVDRAVLSVKDAGVPSF
jgi:hypothetical protein